MHIKIYFNEKPLILCDAIDEEIAPFLHKEECIFIDELNIHSVKSIIHEMQDGHAKMGIFLHPNLQDLKHDFFKKFHLIYAGGGLVSNEKDEFLMIYRRGKWDLPKGKLDAGEDIQDCALREVREETGLGNLSSDGLLIKTWHTYKEGTHTVLKETFWYKMHAVTSTELVPQLEEGIEKAIWVKKEDIGIYLSNCFPSVREVLALA